MEQDWTYVVKDFQGLLSATVARSNKYGLIKDGVCDKRTLDHWLDDKSKPQSASAVAALLRYALRRGVDVDAYQTFTPIYDFSSTLTFEQQADAGPPALQWLGDSQSLPRSSPTRFCGVEAYCPLGIASSPILNDDRWARLMLDLGFGISELKTRRAREKGAHDPPLICFALKPPDLSRYEINSPPMVVVSLKRGDDGLAIPDIVNSIGVPSETPDVWEGIYERVKQHPLGATVGLSIMGDGESRLEVLKAFDELAARAGNHRPPYVTCNISCPNLEKQASDIFRDPAFISDVCRRVKRILAEYSTPLVLKLPWLGEDNLRMLIPKIANDIHGIAFKNTVRVRPVRRYRDGSLQPAFPGPGREFAGMSGPSTRSLTKRGIRNLARIKQEGRYDFDLMAIGGVCDVADVVELLNLGANAVQACTAPMFDPLLAWKLRFHLAHVKNSLREATDEERMMLPRDHLELRSHANMQAAIRVIRSKSPDHKIAESLVTQKWNEWMQRSVTPVPQATGMRVQSKHRREPSVNEWIEMLMPQKW